MNVHGTVVSLRAGAYVAQVGQVGATLLSLTHHGHHLIDPAPPDGPDDAWRGRTLVPWPNRVAEGRYAVGGTAYQLPVNEPETGAALHGLAAFQRWDLTDSTDHSVSWMLDLPASPGYPFQVRCTTSYVLDGDGGLDVTIEGTTTGPVAAPFGASTHPYLSCDRRPLEECTITLPAASVLRTDGRGTPTDLEPVAGTEFDLSGPCPLRGRSVDHAFTDLPAAWSVELTHPTAPGVRLDSVAPWVQLYTGERIGRRGAAVEPMTCPPDAFNRIPEQVLLNPGARRTLRLRIGVLPPRP